MKKQEISLSKYMFIQYALSGICWIIAGISGLFDSLLCDITCICAMSLAVLSSLYLMKNKKEKSDERSEDNEKSARAITQQISALIIAMVLLGSFIVPEGWSQVIKNWPEFIHQMLMIFLGVQELMVGTLFILLERE